MNLHLTLGMGESDRMRALADGRVRPAGIDLTTVTAKVGEIFWRMLKYSEFDAAEMSLAAYAIELSRGREDMIALPVFPSRMFRHSAIYVRDGAGIATPSDLAGRRVGVQEYQMTACIWVRGMLAREYGVNARDIEWFAGGLEVPGRRERIPLKLPPHYRLQVLEPGRTLSAMLLAGELDALISPEMPRAFIEGDPRVVRLFPDVRAAEVAYYQRTGLLPIMHLVVMRRALYERDPWIASELTKAFVAAKDEALRRMYETDHLPYALLWLPQAVEEQQAILGRDWWPYGFARNRRALEAFVDYASEQELLERPLRAEELFAPNTVDDATFH